MAWEPRYVCVRGDEAYTYDIHGWACCKLCPRQDVGLDVLNLSSEEGAQVFQDNITAGSKLGAVIALHAIGDKVVTMIIIIIVVVIVSFLLLSKIASLRMADSIKGILSLSLSLSFPPSRQ